MKLERVTAQPEFAPAPRMVADVAHLARRDRAAFKTVLGILDAWGMDSSESCTLLGISARSFFRWKAQVEGDEATGPLPRDVVERMSYLLGIWKALAILFPEPAHRLHWLRAENSSATFNGQAPMARMLAGNVGDLYVVRNHLDGWRG